MKARACSVKSEKWRNVRTVGNCIYSSRNVLSDIICLCVSVETFSLKYCATVCFNVFTAVTRWKTRGEMALTFLNVGGKYLRLNVCAQLPLTRDFFIRIFNVSRVASCNFIFPNKRFFWITRVTLCNDTLCKSFLFTRGLKIVPPAMVILSLPWLPERRE